MGKKKQKKSKSEAGPAKLPKRIAGVKVPKELREPGGQLLEAISQPFMLDLAAAALAAAATGLAEGLRKSATAAADSPQAPPASRAGAELGAIVALAAIEGLSRLGANAAKPAPDAPAAKAD